MTCTQNRSIGSVLGFVLSSTILLGVVESAVNTVFICFAAGPFEFHKYHKQLSQEMRERWSSHALEPSRQQQQQQAPVQTDSVLSDRATIV